MQHQEEKRAGASRFKLVLILYVAVLLLVSGVAAVDGEPGAGGVGTFSSPAGTAAAVSITR